MGEIEWVDKNIDWFDVFNKVGNYYLGPTDIGNNKNFVYYPLENEKHSDLLQMFTDNHMELKVKYGYYHFLPEKLIIISNDYPQEWCNKSKPHVDDCSELLKRICRIIECSWDYKTKTPIYTEWK
jgi:hypothetical protein